jgi:hypothetical protein
MNEYAWIFIFYSCKITFRIMQLKSRLMSLQVETSQSYIDSRIRLIWISLRLFKISWKIEFRCIMKMKKSFRTINCVEQWKRHKT